MGRYDTPPSGVPRPGPGGQPANDRFTTQRDGAEPSQDIEPASAPPQAWQDATRPPSRAGRNLPMAIGVGVVLGAVVLSSLLIYRQVFLGVIAIAIGVAIWEFGQAMRTAGIRVPVWTLLACGLGMQGLTWFGGPAMLALGLGVTVVVLIIWRFADGATGYHSDIPAATLVGVFVPFLGGFAVLLLLPSDGALRVIAALLLVVLSDTGGYAAGVLAGRHPMAPTISPKKSWEGMAGSLLACAIGGAISMQLMFDVAWWQGAVFGAAMAVAATVGDLTESLIKRDLGVKDMSRLVPGHGGLMDRLDSVLVSLPVAYVFLSYLAPATIG